MSAPISYIVFTRPGEEFEFPVVFSSNVEHKEVARRCSEWKVISAGKIELRVTEMGEPQMNCYGKSVTLNIESRGDIDTELINDWFNRDW